VTGPELVEASPEKLARLQRMRAELAELERKLAAKAPPRPRPWHEQARPEQLPPPGDWDIWLYLAGRGCVAAGTLIYLPIEDRHVPVEDLARAGRSVTVLSLTPDGPLPAETAGAPFVKGHAELYDVVFNDGSRITVTDEHRFLTRWGWLPLPAVGVGLLQVAAGAPSNVPVPWRGAPEGSRWSWGAHRLRGIRPEKTPLVDAEGVKWVYVSSITPAGRGAFYDLRVPGWDNYAANGLWHHNSGKTRSGAEWVIEQAARTPDSEWAVIAPTWRDCQKVCFEGSSGLVRSLLPGEFESMNMSALQLRLTNGSRIYGYSADRPDRLRGANLSGAWIDEIAAMIHSEDLMGEALMPALRIGEHPRVMITTTPRPVKVIKDLVARTDGSVVVVRGTTWDNAANLSKTALAALRARYEGTRMGRQELEAEILEDVEGSLWSRNVLDETRVDAAPHLVRIVVAIDPATTSGEKSDYTGIIVAGKSADGQLYVLEDCTLKGSPHACMVAAVDAYNRWQADRIVGEVNNGGDYIESLLRTVDPNVPYKTVRATRGKTVRAEPIAALWEQGRAHIVKVLPQLEDQMCSFSLEGATGEHDDRVDALTWAGVELAVGGSAMTYLSAISRVCPSCDMPNRKVDAQCRGCGHELPQVA